MPVLIRLPAAWIPFPPPIHIYMYRHIYLYKLTVRHRDDVVHYERIVGKLHDHLNAMMVEYLQFSFRWMNCLLMRELPLQCTIRLWDTYHAEPDGFANFHLYACAAFLATFSKQLLALTEFQDVIMMLQKLPTAGWTEREVAVLLAEAYRWKFMFQDAQAHLNDGS